MDALLTALRIQGVNCALRFGLRSGAALTFNYAIQQYSRLVKTVNDKTIYTELKALQRQLDCKIKVSLVIDRVVFSVGKAWLNITMNRSSPLHST